MSHHLRTSLHLAVACTALAGFLRFAMRPTFLSGGHGLSVTGGLQDFLLYPTVIREIDADTLLPCSECQPTQRRITIHNL